MELSQLNEKLKNFHKLPIVETGEDPDNGSNYTVYKVADEIYVKMMFYRPAISCMLYPPKLVGMQFVKPMEVKVTKFEVI